MNSAFKRALHLASGALIAFAVFGAGEIAAETARDKAHRLVEEANAAPRRFAEERKLDPRLMGVPGKYREAVRLCREATTADPTYYEAHLCLASAVHADATDNPLLWPTKTVDEAIAALNAAIAIDSTRADAYLGKFAIITHHVGAHMYGSASARRVRLAPDSERTLYTPRATGLRGLRVGAALLIREYFFLAIALRLAADLEPTVAQLRARGLLDAHRTLALGTALLALGRAEEARTVLNRVIAASPGRDDERSAKDLLSRIELGCRDVVHGAEIGLNSRC